MSNDNPTTERGFSHRLPRPFVDKMALHWLCTNNGIYAFHIHQYLNICVVPRLKPKWSKAWQRWKRVATQCKHNEQHTLLTSSESTGLRTLGQNPTPEHKARYHLRTFGQNPTPKPTAILMQKPTYQIRHHLRCLSRHGIGNRFRQNGGHT